MTKAVVREENGQIILDDPDALALIQAVEKHNCKITLEQHSDRVAHFKNRIHELGRNPVEVTIVLVNVDDIHGGPLAEVLMPGADWQQFRDRGETPFARGIVERKGLIESLEILDKETASKLLKMQEIPVLVVDHGVTEVFPA